METAITRRRAARLVEDALEFLSRKGAWTQGAFGKLDPSLEAELADDGIYLDDFDSFAEYLNAKTVAHINKACAVGALEVAAKGDVFTPEFDLALKTLAEITIEKRLKAERDEEERMWILDSIENDPQDAIITFNDAAGRKKVEVTNLFRKAKTLLLGK